MAFTSGSNFPFGTSSLIAANAGIPLPFGTVGIGASNSLANIVDRFPLPANFTPVLVTAVCAALVAPAIINVCYGEVAMTTLTATGATAAVGNFLLPTTTPGPLSIAAAGTVYSLSSNASTVYPVGGELTLRVSTPAGGGITGLRVTVWGTL